MKTISWRESACLFLGLALSGGVVAQVQGFDPAVQQARRVQPFAFAVVQGQDGRTASETRNQFQQRPPEAGFFGDYSVTDTLVLEVVAPDGTASAHLETTHSQRSSVTTERIAFEGRIDAFATTSGTPGPLTEGVVGSNGEQGNSGDGNFFGMFFEVSTPLRAVMTLDASVAGGGSAVFELNDHSGGDSRALVFETAADSAPIGGVIDSREIVLNLRPGLYDVTADLTAAVGLDARGTFTAGFTLVAQPLAAVPEANVGVLLLLGLPAIAWSARRRRGT